MMLVVQQVQNEPEFLPYILYRRPPQLAQYIDLDVRVYYAAVQNLVYGCCNVLQITDESRETPPI